MPRPTPSNPEAMLLLVLASLVKSLPCTGLASLASTTDASSGSSSKIVQRIFTKQFKNDSVIFDTYEHETKLK